MQLSIQSFFKSNKDTNSTNIGVAASSDGKKNTRDQHDNDNTHVHTLAAGRRGRMLQVPAPAASMSMSACPPAATTTTAAATTVTAAGFPENSSGVITGDDSVPPSPLSPSPIVPLSPAVKEIVKNEQIPGKMAGPAFTAEPDETLPDYERVRQENIRRNEQFLLELGLGAVKAGMCLPQLVQPTAPGAGAAGVTTGGTSTVTAGDRKRSPRPPRQFLPRRVQPRRGVKDEAKDEAKEEEEEEEEEVEEEEVEFDDSSVLQYLLSASDTSSSSPLNTQKGDVEEPEAQYSRLVPVRVRAARPSLQLPGPGLSPSISTPPAPSCREAPLNAILQSVDLAAVYSMDFHAIASLFVARGAMWRCLRFRKASSSNTAHAREQE